MKTIILSIIFCSSMAAAAAPLCEIAEVNGGLTVQRDGRRISQIWMNVQNFAHADLRKLVSKGYCSVEAGPCEITEYNGGLAVSRYGVRISKIWVNVQGFAYQDLQSLTELGVCE